MSQLEKFRKAKGLLQEDVAKACGVDRSTIAKWEGGLFLPRADKLPALAKILGCTIDELLDVPEKGDAQNDELLKGERKDEC